VALKTLRGETGGSGAAVEAWQGARGTLPNRCWRAASFGGEKAPIRTKLQLNYFSYAGTISISSSHL